MAMIKMEHVNKYFGDLHVLKDVNLEAVSYTHLGTHGKTTTTSMLTEILLAAETDPTISVGGILHSIGGNIRVGGSELFVTCLLYTSRCV